MLAATAALLFAAPAAAQGLDIGGEIAPELRWFPASPQYPDQFERTQASVALTGDIRWRSADRRHDLVVTPFARIDGQDDARTHVDLREAYYRYTAGNGWSATVGLAKVFWGRTESRHLVDIVNQTDAVEDVDEEDKLGQPMVNLTALGGWGTLNLYAMSGFRERTFPGADGRLRFEPAVDRDLVFYESDARRKAPDFAARYSHYIGAFDFGVSAFHGTSREPRFGLVAGEPGLALFYDRISQVGVDAQVTTGALLLKAEAIYRDARRDDFFAAVAGVEYTLYQAFGSGADLGLLVEYQHDGRDLSLVAESPTATALATPFTIADDDVFYGLRLGLNDIRDTSLLMGATTDVDDRSTVFVLEASRRVGDNWRAELESRLFFDVDETSALRPFARDKFMTVRVTRFF